MGTDLVAKALSGCDADSLFGNWCWDLLKLSLVSVLLRLSPVPAGQPLGHGSALGCSLGRALAKRSN